jgi:threonine/homoserine/homoserine lactone efflux protein
VVTLPVDLGLYGTFLGTIALICVIPGPDMVFIFANGIRWGPRGGAAAAVGMAGGMAIHTTAAVVGLSALVRASATGFDLLRAAGVAYLLWLAYSAWRGRGELPDGSAGAGDAAPERSVSRIVRQAAITNLANPKVIVFYLAFLPQFVDRHHGSITWQFVILGATFTAVGLIVDLAVGVASGRLGRRLVRSAKLAPALGAVTSVVFLGLAARLATER